MKELISVIQAVWEYPEWESYPTSPEQDLSKLEDLSADLQVALEELKVLLEGYLITSSGRVDYATVAKLTGSGYPVTPIEPSDTTPAGGRLHTRVGFLPYGC